MSQIYTETGEVEPLFGCEGRVIFRKMVDEEDGAREKRIVAIIKENQAALPNIVNIYDIESKFIDMELLEICDPDLDSESIGRFRRDVADAISQLHSVGIVYVDLKMDNIGYSHDDGRWKLFDFDSSGILDSSDDTKWDLAPPRYHNYKKYSQKLCKQKNDTTTLKDLDLVILGDFLAKHIPKCNTMSSYQEGA